MALGIERPTTTVDDKIDIKSILYTGPRTAPCEMMGNSSNPSRPTAKDLVELLNIFALKIDINNVGDLMWFKAEAESRLEVMVMVDQIVKG